MIAKKLTLKDLLPTDEDVTTWYNDNICESIATPSSSIYKFRLWLKERTEKLLEPIKHNMGGFEYIERKQLK